MLQQAGKVYTPLMFENFQAEWMKNLSLVIKERNEMGLLREYVVGSFGANELEYKVIGGPSNDVVNCACNHFETVGILCCHALKVLDNLDIKLIPSAYILKRWTHKARDGILEKHGLDTHGNGDMDATDRYREVCPEFVKIAVKGSQTIERYEFIKKMILTINKSLDQIPLGSESRGNLTALSEDTSLLTKCMGLKKKDGRKGGKRHKNCLEKNKTKRKKQGDPPQASSQASSAPQVLGSYNMPPGFYSSLFGRYEASQELNMSSMIAPLGDG
ncbi:protein FAR1-RELATED SEQUENCE 3-like [Rhodamnia argentea]|uniref:Protein FAR1-RELATED SEQUENCE n=1 Tax=Rhodamnia argentea TaxID=178133 RepID=A0ABM3H3Z3_9MYRT|nr:protein FAR1-RELATED SEQUENCE 3-like [Rhodamnia argentea]